MCPARSSMSFTRDPAKNAYPLGGQIASETISGWEDCSGHRSPEQDLCHLSALTGAIAALRAQDAAKAHRDLESSGHRAAGTLGARIEAQAHVADLDRRIGQIDMAVEKVAKRGRTLAATISPRRTRVGAVAQRQGQQCTRAAAEARTAGWWLFLLCGSTKSRHTSAVCMT